VFLSWQNVAESKINSEMFAHEKEPCKSENVEDFKLLGHKKPTNYRTVKRFGSDRKCGISSSKARAALKSQTAGCSAKSYRKLRMEDPSSSKHCQKSI
jgi:hypothetical protein